MTTFDYPVDWLLPCANCGLVLRDHHSPELAPHLPPPAQGRCGGYVRSRNAFIHSRDLATRLAGYAQHRPNCPYLTTDYEGNIPACTCGLAELLAELGPR